MSAKLTGADWIGRAAWWLAPLARLIGTTVMTQPVLYTDDTPIRTLAPGTGKTRLSRFWVYAVDPRPHAGPGAPAAFYCYSPDRKGERPRGHLAGFSGVMHADAFAGYDALYRPEPGKPARIQHAACWAHARRKLFEVHEATKSPIAAEALRRIQALYVIEAEITGMPAAERRAERQARSTPLLAEMKTWMEAQRRRASGKTVLGRALQYALGRWEALTRYADDGRLAIDNNVAERLMRGIAVSRNYAQRRIMRSPGWDGRQFSSDRLPNCA
jgi:transposase